MPVYDYECQLHGIFEEEHSIKIKLEYCPKCKEEGIDQKITRLISLGGKGVVELYGQDLVNKCKEDGRKMKEEMHNSANTYANYLGESKYNQLQTQLDRRRRK